MNVGTQGNIKHQRDKSYFVGTITAVKSKGGFCKKYSKKDRRTSWFLQRFLSCLRSKDWKETILNYAELETEFVSFSYFPMMEKKIFGYILVDLRILAYLFAQTNGRTTPLKNEETQWVWADLFLEKHKDLLPIRKPCERSFTKAFDFSKENVTMFFDVLQMLSTNTRVQQAEYTTCTL